MSSLMWVLPLVAAIISIHVGGTRWFGEGLREASAFQGISDFEEERDHLLDGRTRMVRAALGVVSGPDDPLLMWTSYPWPYINLNRVPATRYIWKNFLLGEIYLAGSGPQYVLPGTWETFAADVERTDPTAFVVEAVNPVVSGTPFETLVDDSFTTVYADDVLTLAFRDDLAALLGSPPADEMSPSGKAVVLDPDASEVLEDQGCVRLDGEIVSGASDEASITFGFGSPSSAVVTPTITFARTGGATAAVTSRGSIGTAFTSAAEIASTDATAFTLVVGSRSAVLVLDGVIVGAVETDERDSVTVETSSGGTRLEHLRRSAAPPGSGC